MSKINNVFNKVFRPLQAQETAGTEEFTQGTMRKQFIHTLVNHTGDLKMSKAGAASYYQMCRNRFAGKDLYASHKKWNKKSAEAAKANSGEKSTSLAPTAQEPANEPKVNVDITNKWWVGSKADKSVFASFTSKPKAQAFNRELKEKGINVAATFDSTKVNTEEFKPAAVAV